MAHKPDESSRGRHTAIVFAVVVNHEHDRPLEDIVVYQAAADAGDVFVCLHLFQLSAQ